MVFIWPQASIHMHMGNAVMLVWGTLRLTPINSQMPHILENHPCILYIISADQHSRFCFYKGALKLAVMEYSV